jgi:hypothetical protein
MPDYKNSLVCLSLLVCTLALYSIPCGCVANNRVVRNRDIELSSDARFGTYIHFAVAANGGMTHGFFFPLLQIYDASGRLLYVGHDARANS